MLKLLSRIPNSGLYLIFQSHIVFLGNKEIQFQGLGRECPGCQGWCVELATSLNMKHSDWTRHCHCCFRQWKLFRSNNWDIWRLEEYPCSHAITNYPSHLCLLFTVLVLDNGKCTGKGPRSNIWSPPNCLVWQASQQERKTPH